MGLLSLLYGAKNKLKIAQVEVDVSLSEDHVSTCEVTENPVEIGADVTDHVQEKPDTLTIEGLVSDTPIRLLGNTFGVSDNRARKTYDILREIKSAKKPITVVTGLRQYTNMILRSLTVPRNAETGQALKFTAEFVEVRLVESETIAVELAAKKNQETKSLGKQSTTPASGPAAENGASVLADLTGLGA
jgi:hypothetical protein